MDLVAPTPLKISIDLDGVVFEFLTPYLWSIRKHLGIELIPEQVTDPYWEIEALTKSQQKEVFDYYNTFLPEGLLTLPMKTWANVVIDELKKRGHSILFITSRAPEWRDVTLEALTRIGLEVANEDLFFTYNKLELAMEMEVQVHIDDFGHVAQAFAKVLCPTILFDAPYNRTVVDPRIIRVHNWLAVLRAIQKIGRDVDQHDLEN